MALTKVPEDMHEKFQFVVNLNLSHNGISDLPEEMERMVLVQQLVLAYNHFVHYPTVSVRPLNHPQRDVFQPSRFGASSGHLRWHVRLVCICVRERWRVYFRVCERSDCVCI